MKKLHLLVIKSFIGPFILTFFFVVFVLLMQFLWKYIDDLIGKGLEMDVISEFLLYTSASLVPMALPLAVLLASLMTFGNLAENLELLAFKSSGISLIRIMAPVMVISLVISVGAFFFANDVMPVANLKMRSLLYDIQQQRPELTIRPGIFDNTLEGYSIRIGDRDPRTNLLRDIWIYDHTDDQGNVSVTVADSGYMKMSADEKNLLLTLYNGRSYIELQEQKKENRHIKNYPHRRDRFDKQEMIIEMTGFGLNRTDERLFRNSYAMMNLAQLRHFDDSLSGDIDRLLNNINNTMEHTLKGKSKSILMKPPPPTRAPADRAELRYAGRDITEIDSILAQRSEADRPSQGNAAEGNPEGRNPAPGRSETERMEENNPKTEIPAPENAEAGNGQRIRQIHVDSAFSELTTLEKRRAVTQAINFARSNKSFISSNGGTAEWRITRLRRYQIEIHRKYTLSILCLIFFFIGAPLGAIIRKGGLGVPVIASVLLFLIYYMISITGEKFVRENLMHPFWGMWISTFIMIPVSIFLTYKAVNDSVIMNIETYFTWFKNLRERFFNLLRLA